MIFLGAGGHGGSGKAADLQARYNEIASVVARHTTSSSPSTFRRLVHSSSVDQRGPIAHPSSALASVNPGRQMRTIRSRRGRVTESSHQSRDSSVSSLSEDDYDDYNETDGSDHPTRPIEPILTVTNVGPPVGPSLTQPFQIRSSVHLEHRLGPVTTNQPASNLNNSVATCTVCCIL